ncbi:MAG TPA: hypothetical protein VIM61_00630 [Chthoniobacterales bacterium]
MKTAFAVITLAFAAAAPLWAANPLAPGTRLKTQPSSVLTVKQVIPGEGVLAVVSLNKDIHGNVSTSGLIFIACSTNGVIDGQTLKPVPPIVATAESFSYETVGAGTKTVQKFAFAR